MNDAGKILDAITQLRRLMTALDSSSYALDAIAEEGLSRRLSEDATAVQRVLEELERSTAYQKVRKEYFNEQDSSDPDT